MFFKNSQKRSAKANESDFKQKYEKLSQISTDFVLIT